MSLTQSALGGALWLPVLQAGRGVAELMLALFLLAVVTTTLAYRGIGGQLMRLASLVAVLLVIAGAVLLLL
jgi:hypothetical protein